MPRHRCLLFIEAHTSQPYDWAFMRGDETIEVPVGGAPIELERETGRITVCRVEAAIDAG
jgi:hypothetical protein